MEERGGEGGDLAASENGSLAVGEEGLGVGEGGGFGADVG